jgi:LmbE family N-acetylglucosaminyl deacetylase
MRWIYISPHFDDAVLACGGLIWEQTHNRTPVEIWTVYAGEAQPGPLSPLAMACHQQWGLASAEDVVAARRIENQDAAALVGAETVNFSIPDCIYRRSPTGELLYPEDVFVPIHPSDKNLDSDIAAALAVEMQPDDVVVCPLAIGSHVDHILTRRSVERLGRPIWYYADIPYLFDHPEMLVPATAGLKETLFPIPKKGMVSWQHGISAYKSQVLVLFETGEKMQAAISHYWESQRGLCLWQAVRQ